MGGTVGVIVDLDGSTFVIERRSTEGVVVACCSDCNNTQLGSLEFAKGSFVVIGGGCSIRAAASLGLARGPTGIAPSDCKIFHW